VLSQLLLYTGHRPTASHYPHIAHDFKVSVVLCQFNLYIYIILTWDTLDTNEEIHVLLYTSIQS